MKNKSKLGNATYTRTEVANGGPPIVTVVPFTYAYENVSSSTNTTQNIGDHLTGTPFGYTVSKNTPLHGQFFGTKPATANTWSANATGSFSQSPSPQFSVENTANMSDCETQAANEAIQGAWDNYRGQVDLSVDAFQVKSTLKMIMNPLNGLVSLSKKARQIARRDKRTISSVWLELQYGWRPLVSTAYGIAGMMGNPKSDGLGLFTGQSRKTSSWQYPGSYTLGGYTFKGGATMEYEAKVKAFFLMKIDPVTMQQQAARYTSLDPASIGWELLPYSFVVDWFVDISGYLRTMESATIFGPSLHTGWQSKVTMVTARHNVHTWDMPGWVGSVSAHGMYSQLTFSRTTYTSAPRPSRPSTNLDPTDLSWQRIGSAIALIAQNLK